MKNILNQNPIPWLDAHGNITQAPRSIRFTPDQRAWMIREHRAILARVAAGGRLEIGCGQMGRTHEGLLSKDKAQGIRDGELLGLLKGFIRSGGHPDFPRNGSGVRGQWRTA